jgi:hypothetical protein
MECPDCDHITDVTEIEGKSVCTECGLSFGSVVLVESLPYAADAELEDIAARLMCDSKERIPDDDVYSPFQDVEKANESRRTRAAYRDIDDDIRNLFKADTLDMLRLIWKTFSANDNSRYLHREPYMTALRYIGYVIEKNVVAMTTFTVRRGLTAKCIKRLTTAATSVYSFPSDREIHDLYLDAWLPLITTNLEIQGVVRRLCYQNIPVSSAREPYNIVACSVWQSYLDFVRGRDPVMLTRAGIVKLTQLGFARRLGIVQSILSEQTRLSILGAARPTRPPRRFKKSS